MSTMPQCSFRKAKNSPGVDPRQCKEEALPDRKLCQKHRDSLARSSLRGIQKKKEAITAGQRICSFTGCPRIPEEGYKLCSRCRERLYKARKRVKEATSPARKAGVLCSTCGCTQSPVPGYRYCLSCRQRQAASRVKRRAAIRRVSAASSRKTRALLKQELFDHYGRACTCCEETIEAFLSLDHINGDGAAHRREIGTSSEALYKWAKANNFPATLRTLCMSCNYALGLHGYCPHGNLTQLCKVGRKISETAIPETIREREANSTRNKANQLARKLAVFEAYGGSQCFCCGESHLECLSIDHINGGGRAHVSAVGSLYPWLKKNNYPPGFRVACINCNRGIHKFGSCPHNLR